MWERVGRTVDIVVHLCFEDGGSDEGDSNQLLVCTWGTQDEAIIATPAVCGGRTARL